MKTRLSSESFIQKMYGKGSDIVSMNRRQSTGRSTGLRSGSDSWEDAKDDGDSRQL